MANGLGALRQCTVIMLEQLLFTMLLALTINWRKKSEYLRSTDISMPIVRPYLHGIPVEHKMPCMLEVKKMGLRTMWTTQSSRLVRHTGIRHPRRCLMTRIETLVNIHYLRKNNTCFDGGLLE